MKWLILLLCNFSLFGLEITTEYDKTPEEELREIIGLMDRMETNLRLDRTDDSVQLHGKNIIERLEKLIKDVEIEEVKKQFRTLRQKQLAQIAGILPPPTPEIYLPKNNIYKPPLDRKDFRTTWANLPPITRDSLLQDWNHEIPVRWQLRIAAYYLSIATEETKPVKRLEK